MEMLVFRMERQFPGEIKKAHRAKQTIVSSKVKMNMIHEAFFTIFALLVAALDIGILVYAWNSGNISAGAVVALILLVDNAYTPIAIFNVLYVQYKLDRASFHRFEEFFININNLTFRYGERKIFEDLCLNIKRGEKVAFVGESGSGKSTLVKILAGLLKYDTGSIQVGGVELKDICLDALYANMDYLSQETPVFDGTIRENLVFDKEMPQEQMIEALKRTQLLTLLENSAQGLDTEIVGQGTFQELMKSNDYFMELYNTSIQV